MCHLPSSAPDLRQPRDEADVLLNVCGPVEVHCFLCCVMASIFLLAHHLWFHVSSFNKHERHFWSLIFHFGLSRAHFSYLKLIIHNFHMSSSLCWSLTLGKGQRKGPPSLLHVLAFSGRIHSHDIGCICRIVPFTLPSFASSFAWSTGIIDRHFSSQTKSRRWESQLQYLSSTGRWRIVEKGVPESSIEDRPESYGCALPPNTCSFICR